VDENLYAVIQNQDQT